MVPEPFSLVKIVEVSMVIASCCGNFKQWQMLDQMDLFQVKMEILIIRYQNRICIIIQIIMS